MPSLRSLAVRVMVKLANPIVMNPSLSLTQQRVRFE